MIHCSRCHRDITTMKNLIKPSKFKWICKCGKDVTQQKLNQLMDYIAQEYQKNFKED